MSGEGNVRGGICPRGKCPGEMPYTRIKSPVELLLSGPGFYGRAATVFWAQHMGLFDCGSVPKNGPIYSKKILKCSSSTVHLFPRCRWKRDRSDQKTTRVISSQRSDGLHGHPRFRPHLLIPLNKKEVWPPGSVDTLCSRRPLMTQVQHWSKSAQTDHVTLRP